MHFPFSPTEKSSLTQVALLCSVSSMISNVLGFGGLHLVPVCFKSHSVTAGIQIELGPY